jgi:hypothetical protein
MKKKDGSSNTGKPKLEFKPVSDSAPETVGALRIRFTDGGSLNIPFFIAEEGMRIPSCCDCGANIFQVVKILNKEKGELEEDPNLN